MTASKIELTVNDQTVRGEVEPRMHLADFLREDLLLTGTHLGCEQGVCGACTVMIDGRPSRSCITLAVSCDAADVRTIESFDDDPLMAKLREAFTRHHGLQCGFCTPGFLATSYDIVRRLPQADSARIRKELSGNLCRCTGYQGAVRAVEDVLANVPPSALLQSRPRSRSRVTADVGIANEATTNEVTKATSVSRDDYAVPDELKDGVRLVRQVPVAASAEQVWQVLSDISVVASCVPGAHLDGPIEGNTVRGYVAVGIGPMRANFNGVADVQLDEVAKSGRIIGRGSDRLSRSSLDGALEFKLSSVAVDRSQLDLDILYQLKGPLAQLGRPAIVEEIADRLLDETARTIAARATGDTLVAPAQRSLGLFGLIWSAVVGLFKGATKRS